MRKFSLQRIVVFAPCLFLLMTTQALSDVSPGDVIDKTNWEKAEGLVPEELLGWIKKGDFVLEVGEMNYKARDFQPPYALKALSANRGKYALDENGWIVEKQTGKRLEHIIGHPFPEIDPDDPKVGEMILYNRSYTQYIGGNVVAPFSTDYVKDSGYGRSTKGLMHNMVMDGNPKSVERRNPDRVEKYQIFVARSPYDIAGTAVMTWRYFDPQKQDNTFAYVPAIRRVRRMSSGNRSDALFGSDFAVDDAGGYDGKVTAMEWKFLRKQQALVPFPSSGPGRIVEGEKGGWQSSENMEVMVYGYQKEGWQGAPWAPVNWLWVKQPVYVIETKAKDPYYNYGTQYVWIYAETWNIVYKTVNDKAGKYWKTFMGQPRHFENSDKGFHLTYIGDQVVIDERSKHATVITGPSPKDIWSYLAELDENDFSLAGFQKFCK